jgi:glycosyltransferase involved in cell wall biosynthesis
MMQNNNTGKDISYCVIIPTYNHSGTIAGVINAVSDITRDIILVNDGSTDNTSEILKRFSHITVIEYKQNRGKGYALMTGFKAAIEKGFEYAVTIDSDGQHRAEEIPLFIKAVSENRGAIVIGSRNLVADNMPEGNTFANNFSNFWFRLQTGINLPDTQSGFRLYPLKEIMRIRTFSGRYEYELELLVRAAWRDILLVTVPVTVIYAPGEERVTHFRPYADFIRISVLNTFLTIIALVYARPARLFKKLLRNASDK